MTGSNVLSRQRHDRPSSIREAIPIRSHGTQHITPPHPALPFRHRRLGNHGARSSSSSPRPSARIILRFSSQDEEQRPVRVIAPGAPCAGDFCEEEEKTPAAGGEEGEKTFLEEMRATAMRMHTKDQASEGEKELVGPSLNDLEPNLEAYVRFLVDSKLIFQTLEDIVDRAAVPWYAEFRNTGLERSEAPKKDLEWFSEQGHTIPEPSADDTRYASYLEELSEKDQHAFFCHYYNMYFGQSAGGRFTGKKIADKILNKKELEFYKWEGTLSDLLQNVRTKLNQVASSWTREEKNHCLEETKTSFVYSGERLRKIFT